MRKLFILFLWLSCLPMVTRGQTIEDEGLSELLQSIQVKALRYWFDDADDSQTVNDLSGTYTLDVSSLHNGLHTLHYQLIGTDGGLYDVSSQTFLKPTSAEIFPHTAIDGCKLKYWFDDDANSIQTLDNITSTYVLDVSALNDGLHTLHYLLVGDDGVPCGTASDVFIKMEDVLLEDILGTPVVAKHFAYWFDDDANSLHTVNDLSGVYSLDVSSLTDGLHILHYHVVGDDGSIYGTTSAMFLKNEAQYAQRTPNGITKYTYWLNGNSTPIQTVTLDNATNPYTLLALLPVQPQPIRSSSFHFQMNDGVPTLYAKNDLHIRFYDARGEFVDNFVQNERTYIDYGVSRQVVPVGEVQESQTFSRMGENEIRWYTVKVEEGDTVAFKSSQACTMQLFSPSGEEVYTASGSASVAYGGCHTWESGTYYLAVHDATGSQSTIALDYLHMDKYAVVSQDVAVVGNGGYTTISFNGNGFSSLYSVDLVNEQNDIIKSIYIDHQSDAFVGVDFDFSDVSVGEYNAIFHFADEELLVERSITIEVATPLVLETELNANHFRAGSPFCVNIRIHNGGNNTAYKVPVRIALSGPVNYIKFLGEEQESLYDRFDKSEMSLAEKESLKELSDKMGNTNDFYTFKDEDSNSESKEIVLTLDISPCSVVNVALAVSASGDVKTSVETPREWNHVHGEEYTGELNPMTMERVCCYNNKLECWGDKITQTADIIAAIGSYGGPYVSLATSALDCAVNYVNTHLKLPALVTQCSQPSYESQKWETVRQFSNKVSWWSALPSCLSMIPGAKAMQVTSILFSAFNATATSGSCHESLSRDCSNSKWALSQMLESRDPNEIMGYTSPSGSKYISNDVHNLNYIIEFENDPEVATAPAHEIVITDQLDGTKFDLSTFTPTRVEIGQKSAELNGDKNFVTTIDMRPEIYAIAQVEGAFDESTGLAKWHIVTLDPMTMEPTEDALQGVLPVNTDGNGIGQVSFDIKLKEGLAQGTEIPNRATIIFDANEPITTPTWTNVIDRIAPESRITKVEQVDGGETASVSVEANDELSGVWRYDVYVQYESGAWFLAAENVSADTTATVKLYEGINHHFYAVATDMAGNMEQKEAINECSLYVEHITKNGDVNGDGSVTAQDASLVQQLVAKKVTATTEGIVYEAADVNGDGEVTAQDASLIQQHVAKKIDLSTINQ